MFSEDFFLLNTATNFSFPHHNCDEIPTEKLVRLFFHPDYFCWYIVRHFGKTPDDSIVEKLRAHPTLATIGTAFMRLKFLVEVLDPKRLLHRIQAQKKAGAFLREEMSAIWDWLTEAAERYAHLDRLANYMCAAMIEIIRDIVGNAETPREFSALSAHATMLNTQIPTIREKPCEIYAWSAVAPYELVNYPYFMFVIRTWSVLEKIQL